MVNSINTNAGAAHGVQQLNKTTSILDQIRERVATGKKVNGPKDDAAVYAIAKNERQFVERFCEAAKDADLILVADTGSTDASSA